MRPSSCECEHWPHHTLDAGSTKESSALRPSESRKEHSMWGEERGWPGSRGTTRQDSDSCSEGQRVSQACQCRRSWPGVSCPGSCVVVPCHMFCTWCMTSSTVDNMEAGKEMATRAQAEPGHTGPGARAAACLCALCCGVSCPLRAGAGAHALPELLAAEPQRPEAHLRSQVVGRLLPAFRARQQAEFCSEFDQWWPENKDSGCGR